MKFTPASVALSKTRKDSASSVCLPNVPVPKQRRETVRPVRLTCVSCIKILLCSSLVELRANVRDAVPIKALVETARAVPDMRGSKQVFDTPIGVVLRQGLDIEDIDRRPSDPMIAERIQERGLDHEGTAAGCQVLAPGNDVHAEREPDLRHP